MRFRGFTITNDRCGTCIDVLTGGLQAHAQLKSSPMSISISFLESETFQK